MCKHSEEQPQRSRTAHHNWESKNQSHWQSALMVLTGCTVSGGTTEKTNRSPEDSNTATQAGNTHSSCGTDAFLAKRSSASLCSSPLLSNDNRDTHFLDRPQHLDIHNPELVVTSCPLLRLIQHRPKHYQEILPTLSYELSLRIPCRNRLNKHNFDYKYGRGSLWLVDLDTKKTDFTRNWKGRTGRSSLRNSHRRKGVEVSKEYSRITLSNRTLCKDENVLYLYCLIQ